MNRLARTTLGLVALLLAGGCGQRAAEPDGAAARGTQDANADAFVARVNAEFVPIARELAAAQFTQATNITPDTEFLSARANERYLAYFTRAVEQSQAWIGKPASSASLRAIEQLKFEVDAPAPADPQKRAQLTEILTRLDALYGAGKWCPDGPESCRNLDQLSEVIATSRDPAALAQAWTGWHSISREMRPLYMEFVQLANEGARELGYADLGAFWRSKYDMQAEEFAQESDRLWSQVEPLYEALHCYTRRKLADEYGTDKVPLDQPIPAHLLGNMWAQTWNRVYDDLLKPYPRASIETADRALAAQKWDAIRMTRSAESFYTSIGFPALPASFWERSMFTRPRDREVVCHASAWDMGEGDDVRIKMCIQPVEEDLFTVYHELGHVYYYLWYADQPHLFQRGAHDGFHEAIGDTVNLSVTPAYLNRIGLVSAVKPSSEALINEQMKMALEKVAFLPFGKLIDEWRWQVFSGAVPPERYNAAWWELRRRYQGVEPPVTRSEADFDPGAKYHIPGNTPYMRYFLSFLLQFQFHEALCEAAGHQGPLHECSIFGNEAAGKRFGEMLAAGASEPWQDTMEKLTGTRSMDASALLEYFAPLQAWLAEQNQGQQCGWQ